VTPQTTFQHLRTELPTEGRILRLELDAGKGNVVNSDVVRELREVVALAATQELVCLLLDHTGKHFSYGASVEDHTPDRVGEFLKEFHELAREVLALNLPVIACVRGMCLGGGLEIALLADQIFASPSAVFAQPEIELGVFAPLGSVLLPRRVGSARAADLLLSGRRMDAAAAQEAGLVSMVADDPTEAARSWIALHLAPKSAAALRFATRALRVSWSGGFLRDLANLEALYLGELMSTHDAQEGISAFLEKRRPVWENR